MGIKTGSSLVPEERRALGSTPPTAPPAGRRTPPDAENGSYVCLVSKQAARALDRGTGVGISQERTRQHGCCTFVSQTAYHKGALVERGPRHVDQVTMMREQHHLSSFGESRECAQDVRRSFIVRGDEHVVQYQRHLRV